LRHQRQNKHQLNKIVVVRMQNVIGPSKQVLITLSNVGTMFILGAKNTEQQFVNFATKG